jgi:hypothetical protein
MWSVSELLCGPLRASGTVAVKYHLCLAGDGYLQNRLPLIPCNLGIDIRNRLLGLLSNTPKSFCLCIFFHINSAR